MATVQYREGSCAVTNGSQTVTGTDTLWSGEITTSHVFMVDLDGEVSYGIASVDSDTQITLSANYGGSTDSGLAYVIQRDFTVNRGYDKCSPGDGRFPELMGMALDKIDEDIAQDRRAETVTTGSPALKVYGSTSLDSSGGAITGTLGSGEFIGQTKTIVMTDATTSSTISITNHETSDPEVATFDAVGEVLVLLWAGTEWVTLKATCTFV